MISLVTPKYNAQMSVVQNKITENAYVVPAKNLISLMKCTTSLGLFTGGHLSVETTFLRV